MTPTIKEYDELYSLLDDLCDGSITAADAARLDDLLQRDPRARREYLAYLEVHAGLGLISGKQPVSPPLSVEPSLPSLPASHYPLSANFVGGPVFSYLVATVVLCLMLLGSWAYKVSHVQPSAPGTANSNIPPLPIYVGRITGIRDCRWADPNTQTVIGASVALNRRYALASGLLEITYLTGARVILEGPCTYRIESSAGGFLTRGKLTANIRGQNSEHSSLIPHPSYFVVTTPTAVITDLGTEFGVEVGENGDTLSHVFQGSVRVENGEGGMMQLAVGESILVEKGESKQVRFTHPTTTPKFVRRLYKPPEELDLLDIIAGDNGMGQRRDGGIDPTTGRFMRTPIERGRDGDNLFRPIYWNRLIDGAFVPVEGEAVQLDSAGNTFDGFLGASGRTFGHIWTRAADADPNTRFDGVRPWMYSLGRIERFVPRGKGILAMHPNAGLTFDLQAACKRYRGLRPQRFLAVVGLADSSDEALMPEGTVDFRVFIDGRTKLERLGLKHKSDAETVEVAIGPNDRFLTLVATDGGDGITSDWFILGDPVLKMAPNIKEENDSMNK